MAAWNDNPFTGLAFAHQVEKRKQVDQHDVTISLP